MCFKIMFALFEFIIQPKFVDQVNLKIQKGQADMFCHIRFTVIQKGFRKLFLDLFEKS